MISQFFKHFVTIIISLNLEIKLHSKHEHFSDQIKCNKCHVICGIEYKM